MQFNKQDFELFESICEKLGVTASDNSHQGIIIDGVDGIEFLRDNHIIDFDDPPININCMPFNSTIFHQQCEFDVVGDKKYNQVIQAA